MKKDTNKTDVLFLIEQPQDLFEHIESLPTDIKDLLEFYSTFFEEGMSYQKLGELKDACEKIGYTFDYGLSAEPFNLNRIDEPQNIFAYFPNESDFNDKDLRTSYAHIGQHSSCHIDYANECEKATNEQYNDLAKELEHLGYNLNILNN
jgi:hypothetical protein